MTALRAAPALQATQAADGQTAASAARTCSGRLSRRVMHSRVDVLTRSAGLCSGCPAAHAARALERLATALLALRTVHLPSRLSVACLCLLVCRLYVFVWARDPQSLGLVRHCLCQYVPLQFGQH